MQLIFFGHQTVRRRGLFDFFPVCRTKDVIPKPAGNAKVYVRVLVMNEVVSAQSSILSILEMEVMMHVMKESVKNKSR